LVVGGSRGLGEVMAKLLAAGGAEVFITFHQGREEAEKLAAEITLGGGRAQTAQLDVLQPARDLARLAPTHLYYFASPHIATGAAPLIETALLRKFLDYYVHGLARLVELLRPTGLKLVYYPSTVFLDTPPAGFAEYAVAKGAGEALCRVIQKQFPEIICLVPRLPKLATDQTVSLDFNQSPEPLPVLLDTLLGQTGTAGPSAEWPTPSRSQNSISSS
jgi:NAD(P)-dependent dehydrogenase (short-subunit alcohol dehydrogenase family)